MINFEVNLDQERETDDKPGNKPFDIAEYFICPEV